MAMVMIETRAEASVTVEASPERAFALVRDVPAAGAFIPGVVRIEPVGDDTYRWQLQPRRGVGTTFTPDYVCRYTDNGRDEVSFQTVEGNVNVRGTWRVTPSGAGARITLSVHSEVDVPVPRLMKKPASLFASRDAQSSVERQLAGIKRRLDREAGSTRSR
jgi:carbon monoxide dehydrogenase subunit G